MPATPTILLVNTPSTSYSGQTVQFAVTVSGGSGTPTGTVVFSSNQDGTMGSVTLSGGKGLLTDSILTVNTHTITATYSGDVNYNSGMQTVMQTVDQYSFGSYSFAGSSNFLTQNVESKATPTLTLISTENPSRHDDAVTFNITVTGSSGTPTGTITLTDSLSGFPPQLLTLVAGATSYGPISTLSIASHLITAAYSGDTIYNSASTNLIQLVLTQRGTELFDLPGFALFASFSEEGDVALPAWATFTAVPSSTTAGTPVYILWSSNNVAAVSIEGAPTLINTNGSGIYEFVSGFSVSTVVTCIAYDSLGNIVTTENVLITIT